MGHETALEVMRDIIGGLGGSTGAKTLVPALKDLRDALAGGTLVVNLSATEGEDTSVTYALDQTASAIAAAAVSSSVMLVIENDGTTDYVPFGGLSAYEDGSYTVDFGNYTFEAATGDDYPSYTDGGK